MGTYLQHEYLSGGPIYVEFAIRRIVRINALARQEVNNVLGPILISVGGRNLYRGA